MTLRFRWDWEPEPDVRLPELAATWCRLSIDLDDTPATLVERRDGSGGPRHGIDVAAYPLAEHLAINWWQLSAPSHLPSGGRVRLVGASSGFAWPDLVLRNDRGLMWATLRRRDKAPEHVRFLTQAETVLNTEGVLSAISDFIDSTVRRLEDKGIAGTLLQDEWAAIQHADESERDFCLAAAAWGQDPYDTPSEVAQQLHATEARIGSSALLADLARAVPLGRLGDSSEWLLEAANALDPRVVSLPILGPLDWSSTAGVPPWRIGYERARRLRGLLGLDPRITAPVEELLAVGQTQSSAPTNIDALIRAEDASSLAVVVGAGASPKAKRFASARAIGRHCISPAMGPSLLTRTALYTERTERAFAAEFLAPADGIADILAGDFSDDALQRAADHFNVHSILVQHQVENQIAA